MDSAPDNCRFERRICGDFGSLKDWLNEKIHRRGKQFRAQRLVEAVTGESLSPKPLVRHLHQKFDELYGL